MVIADNSGSVFARLEAQAGVASIVDLHYERVLADEHLGEYFMGVDVDRLKAVQLGFLRKAFGDPDAVYTVPA